MKTKPDRTGKRGIVLVIGVFFLAAWLGVLGFTVKDTFFSERSSAQAQGRTADPLAPVVSTVSRHKILDRRHAELAVSFKMHSVYARPLEISNPEEGAEFLAGILELDKKALLRDLRAERSFVWLGRHVSEEQIEKVQKRNLQGVYIIDESQRYYPFHQSASHIVGFLKDGHGLAGVESYYDRILKVLEDEGPPAGSMDIKGHIVLTVDIRIQELLERQLGIVSAEVDAGSAVGIVMRPSTGAILALSSLPTYDPNLFWDFGAAERRNLAVNEMLHFGGFTRLFRLAAYYETEGRDLGGGGVQHDSIEALRKSLQTSRAPRVSRKRMGYFNQEVGQKVSAELHWAENFKLSQDREMKFQKTVGLTRESGVDLPLVNSVSFSGSGEDISNEEIVNENGQQVTAISLVTAFSRIINDGGQVAPHLGTGILGPTSGKMAKLRHGKDPALLPDTTRRVRKFLEGFAGENNGPVLMESFTEIRIQGDLKKDGQEDTQKIEAKQLSVKDAKDSDRIEPSRYQSVLLGFAPADKPDLVMLIAFNGAAAGFDKKSPMRIMAEKNFSLIRKLAEDDELPVTEERDQSHYANAYQEWQKSQQSQKKRAEKGSDGALGLMPDLRGVSLRKALQVIQPLGLKVQVKGSGTVFSQSPGQGMKIHDGLCVIELKEDRA